jgi:hypothetical protein
MHEKSRVFAHLTSLATNILEATNPVVGEIGSKQERRIAAAGLREIPRSDKNRSRPRTELEGRSHTTPRGQRFLLRRPWRPTPN